MLHVSIISFFPEKYTSLCIPILTNQGWVAFWSLRECANDIDDDDNNDDPLLPDKLTQG
jgi:hypothetical protein